MSSGYKPISSPPVEVGWSASLEKTLDTLSKSWPEVALKVGEFLKKVDRFLIEIIDRELVLPVLDSNYFFKEIIRHLNMILAYFGSPDKS